MAKRRTYKRDRRGRFASTGSSRARRIGRKINRRRPRYVRGSVAKTVRVGRVGPGGEYAGIHVGAQLEVVPGLVEVEVAVPRSRPAVW